MPELPLPRYSLQPRRRIFTGTAWDDYFYGDRIDSSDNDSCCTSSGGVIVNVAIEEASEVPDYYLTSKLHIKFVNQSFVSWKLCASLRSVYVFYESERLDNSTSREVVFWVVVLLPNRFLIDGPPLNSNSCASITVLGYWSFLERIYA